MAAKDKPVDGTLVSYVHVADDHGAPVAFGPDDQVPEWAARKISAYCWEGGEHPLDGKGEPDSEHASSVPPKAGRGSSTEAWVAYAKAHDVEVADGASREDVIEALAAAGVPTE